MTNASDVDKDGYNIFGYDRDGYDRDGYDKFGYDRKKERMREFP